MDKMIYPGCYIQKINKLKNTTGDLIPLVNSNLDQEPRIEQVYLATCKKGIIKGPHFHNFPKRDRFYCIQGSCLVVCHAEGFQGYQEFILNAFDEQILVIPPYHSHALLSLTDESVIVSMPSEGYNPNKPYNQTNTTYKDYDWSKWIHE